MNPNGGLEAQATQGAEDLPLSNDPSPRVTFDYHTVPAVMRGASRMRDSLVEVSTTHGED